MKRRLATVLILLFAFCGLADSAYLTDHERNGTPLICNIDNLTGCNLVAQSSYSHLFGVPLAEYGLLFYGLLFIVAAIELMFFHHLVRRSMQVIAGAGFIISIYFVVIQLFVIKAVCIYCLVSAALTFLIFIASRVLAPVAKLTHEGVSTMPATPGRLSMPPAA